MGALSSILWGHNHRSWNFGRERLVSCDDASPPSLLRLRYHPVQHLPAIWRLFCAGLPPADTVEVALPVKGPAY